MKWKKVQHSPESNQNSCFRLKLIIKILLIYIKIKNQKRIKLKYTFINLKIIMDLMKVK